MSKKYIFIAYICQIWYIIAMKWEELLQIVGKEPVFHSSLLKTGPVDPVDLGRQLSRWVNSGKLLQIRRGLYALSERYQKTTPHPLLSSQRFASTEICACPSIVIPSASLSEAMHCLTEPVVLPMIRKPAQLTLEGASTAPANRQLVMSTSVASTTTTSAGPSPR